MRAIVVSGVMNGFKFYKKDCLKVYQLLWFYSSVQQI